MKKINVKYVILTILSIFAFSLEIGVGSFEFNQLIFVLAAIGLYMVFEYNKGEKISKTILLLAFLLSFSTLIGHCFTISKDIEILYSSLFKIIRSILILIGYSIFYTEILLLLKKLFEKSKMKDINNSLLDKIFNKHAFIYPVIILLVCYLPILIAFYPGNTTSDGNDELHQYYHQHSWTLNYINLIDENVYINGHHSPFHAYIIGSISNLGNKISSANMGLFLNIIAQLFLALSVFGYLFIIFKRLKIPKQYRLFTLLFLAICPFFNIYIVTLIKDIPFVCILLLYSCLIVNIVTLKNNNYKNIFGLILVSILLALINNKGIYIVFLTSLFLLLTNKNEWKKYLLVLLIPLLLYTGYTKVVLPALKVTPGGKQEILAIPIQQISNCVIEHRNDISIQDETNIRVMLDYDNLEKDYDPFLVDPVKKNFNKDHTKEDLIAFGTTWGRLFLKYPESYIESSLSLASKSFYTGRKYIAYWDLRPKRKTIKEMEFSKPIFTHKLSMIIKKLYLNFYKIPVLNLFVIAPIFVWGIIIMAVYITKKYGIRKISCFIPAIVVILFLFLSPASGNNRYLLPLVWCFPLLFGYIIYLKQNDN